MRNGFVLAITLVVVCLGVQAAYSSPAPGSGDAFKLYSMRAGTPAIRCGIRRSMAGQVDTTPQ